MHSLWLQEPGADLSRRSLRPCARSGFQHCSLKQRVNVNLASELGLCPWPKVGYCAPQLQHVYNVEPDAVHASQVLIREVLRLYGGRKAGYRIEKQQINNILGKSSKSYENNKRCSSCSKHRFLNATLSGGEDQDCCMHVMKTHAAEIRHVLVGNSGARLLERCPKIPPPPRLLPTTQ